MWMATHTTLRGRTQNQTLHALPVLRAVAQAKPIKPRQAFLSPPYTLRVTFSVLLMVEFPTGLLQVSAALLVSLQLAPAQAATISRRSQCLRC